MYELLCESVIEHVNGLRIFTILQDLALTNCLFCSPVDERQLVPYVEFGGWCVNETLKITNV